MTAVARIVLGSLNTPIILRISTTNLYRLQHKLKYSTMEASHRFGAVTYSCTSLASFSFDGLWLPQSSFDQSIPVKPRDIDLFLARTRPCFLSLIPPSLPKALTCASLKSLLSVNDPCGTRYFHGVSRSMIEYQSRRESRWRQVTISSYFLILFILDSMESRLMQDLV